ncbi:hypothetical protein SCNU_19747, partial [Gordonia neofelifaecis NRRL B-59395]
PILLAETRNGTQGASATVGADTTITLDDDAAALDAYNDRLAALNGLPRHPNRSEEPICDDQRHHR